MEYVIETEDLTKRFGKIQALDGLSLNVPSGSVFGFLGPNGAGKTTTMRLLTALIHPDRGSIRILGEDLLSSGPHALDGVGSMVEDPAFYDYLSGRKNLQIFGDMIGDVKKDEIEGVLQMTSLGDRADDRVKTYSHGMKQRLGIACAMLGEPDILLLDEPTSGLDPKGTYEVRNIIKRLAERENVTIFLSSHLLYEVSQVCDNVCVINKGKHVVSGKVKELLSEEEEVYEVKVSDTNKAQRILEGQGMKVTPEKETLEVSVKPNEGGNIARLLVSENIDVYSLIPRIKSLETFFLEVTEDGTAATDKN